jgi:exodeoxyribonuclease VII large subunit
LLCLANKNWLSNIYPIMSDLFLSVETENQTLSKTSLQSNSGQEAEFLNVNSKAKEIGNQVEWVITHRKAEYVAELLGLQKHKSVAVRRKVATGLGLLGTVSLVPEIRTWQLSEPDRETWLVLESTVDKLQRKNSASEVEQNVIVLSVSEALKRIKTTVSEREFMIEGELTEIKPIGAMYFFGIKDKQDTRIDCYVYSGKVLGFGFPLNDGWEVRVSGKFKIDKYGKLKFEIENMQLTGEGELLRNLILLEQKLETEGLFDLERKRVPTILPIRILLLASPNSAAIQDFQKVLASRRSGVTVYFLPIKTQGVGAEFEILQKLELANVFCQKYDIQTVVLTRGGGSKDDLMVALTKPSIVAIGHERDFCLSERAADIRASTPSNAAELVSLSNEEVLGQLDFYQQFILRHFAQRQGEYKSFTQGVFHTILLTTKSEVQAIKSYCKHFENIILQQIQSININVSRTFSFILHATQTSLYESKELLTSFEKFKLELSTQIQNYQLVTSSLWKEILSSQTNLIQVEKQNLDLQNQKLQLYNPQNILELGYAIVKQNDKIVDTKKDFKTKAKTTLQFKDGEAVV